MQSSKRDRSRTVDPASSPRPSSATGGAMLDNALETRATDTSALTSAETPRRKNAKGSPFNQVIYPFVARDARELLDSTTHIRGSAKRNTAFTLQHGA